MTFIDLSIVAVAALGLIVWIRGCARVSASDCGLGLALGAIAAASYFLLFNLTRTEWLGAMVPGAFLLVQVPFRGMWKSRCGGAMAVTLVAMTAGAAIGEYKFISAGNSLLVIEPYRVGNTWAFDEPRLGLRGEPFVKGIPEMIDRLVAGIPGSDRSVRLIFSQRRFPGAQVRVDRTREENGGNWYACEEYGMEGWLCPALFKFFTRAPRHLWIKAEARA